MAAKWTGDGDAPTGFVGFSKELWDRLNDPTDGLGGLHIDGMVIINQENGGVIVVDKTSPWVDRIVHPKNSS